MISKIELYNNKIKGFNIDCDYMIRQNVYLSFFRLFVALLILPCSYYSFSEYKFISLPILLILIVLFFVLLRRYDVNDKRISRLKKLVSINENEISILKGMPNLLFSDGSKFMNEKHSYTSDLDIFGARSVYEYINRCNSIEGANVLAGYLSILSEKDEIQKRQEAAKELSGLISFRQEIIQNTILKNKKELKPFSLKKWMIEPSGFEGKRILYFYVRIVPLISICFIVLAFMGHLIPINILVLLNIFIGSTFGKRMSKMSNIASYLKDELSVYYAVLKNFETQEFKSCLLLELKHKLNNNSGFAHIKIKKLFSIVSMLDHMSNIFIQMTLNLFFLWNFQILYRFLSWKKQNADYIGKCIEIVGEIEALSSLATLSYNNSDWDFPEFIDSHLSFEGIGLGHPMIPKDKRVCNDYSISGVSKVSLITGSNMAGKSTFLRTIGINSVLAFAGAPVCATKLSLSLFEVNTSMRIKDSLENNESSFYAELKRIKFLLEKVNRGDKTLLLLDEILRGTNSIDKNIGAKALIKQLLKNKAIALIATHDIELSDMEQDFPDSVSNSYFDIKIEDDNLFFDYKINSGVCKTFNAPILMKKMGIDIELI